MSITEEHAVPSAENVRSDSHVTLPLGLGLIVAGIIGSFVGYTSNNFMPLLMSSYIDFFKISPSGAGFIATLESAFILATTFLVAKRLNVLPSRRMLSLGVVIALIGQIGCMVNDGGALLIAARVISGIGFGILLAIVNATVARTEDPERFFAMIWALGAFLDAAAFYVATVLMNEVGQSGLFLAIIIFLACGWLATCRLPQLFTASDDESNLAEENKSIGYLLLFGILMLFTALGGLWSFS